MKKALFLILFVWSISVRADPVTVTIVLSDAAQAAYARVQTRETDTNIAALKPADYVAALLMQSVNGVTKQEKAADVQMITAKLQAADAATKASVQTTLGVASKDVIPAD